MAESLPVGSIVCGAFEVVEVVDGVSAAVTEAGDVLVASAVELVGW